MDQIRTAFEHLEEMKKKFVGSGDDHDRFRNALNTLGTILRNLVNHIEGKSAAQVAPSAPAEAPAPATVEPPKAG